MSVRSLSTIAHTRPASDTGIYYCVRRGIFSILSGRARLIKIGARHNQTERVPNASEVRFGSQADILVRKCDVCFTPKSGHCRPTVECPLCAKSRLVRCSKHFVIPCDLVGECNCHHLCRSAIHYSCQPRSLRAVHKRSVVAVIIIVAPVSSSSDASIVTIIGLCLTNRHHDA